jgi:hypothetical protein
MKHIFIFATLLLMQTTHTMELQPLIQTEQAESKKYYLERAGIGALGGLLLGCITSVACIFTPPCSNAMDGNLGFGLFVTLGCPAIGAGVSVVSAYVKRRVEQGDRNSVI